MTQESGDSLTGSYSSTWTGSSGSTLEDSGSNADGSFSVSETSAALTIVGQKSGDNISGSYSSNVSSTDTYTLTEAGVDWTITENGTNTPTTQETGNTVLGTYSRTQTGADVYSITETGTNSGGSYSEVVTGTDTYTLSESGNTANQTFTRTITGGGSYTRTDTGPGATLPNGSGNISYSVQESGDERAGLLSQSETGTDRYGLLQVFNNVANTGASTPGYLDFSPVGLPFSDLDPKSAETAIETALRLAGQRKGLGPVPLPAWGGALAGGVLFSESMRQQIGDGSSALEVYLPRAVANRNLNAIENAAQQARALGVSEKEIKSVRNDTYLAGPNGPSATERTIARLNGLMRDQVRLIQLCQTAKQVGLSDDDIKKCQNEAELKEKIRQFEGAEGIYKVP